MDRYKRKFFNLNTNYLIGNRAIYDAYSELKLSQIRNLKVKSGNIVELEIINNGIMYNEFKKINIQSNKFELLYSGTTLDGNLHGNGVLILRIYPTEHVHIVAIGEFLEGNFIRGIFVDIFSKNNPGDYSLRIYEGEFKSFKLHGLGRICTRGHSAYQWHVQYEGFFSEGYPDGYVKHWYTLNNDLRPLYEGEMKQWVYNGLGRLFDKEKDKKGEFRIKHEGEFSNGKSI